MKKTLRAALVLSFLFCSSAAFAATAESVSDSVPAKAEATSKAGVAAPAEAAPAVEAAAPSAAPSQPSPLAKTVFDEQQKKNVDACCFAACLEAWNACKRPCNFEQSCLDQCWADWQWCKSVC